MAKDPIKKAENGTYYFRANLGYHPVTGKQIQKYRSGFSTKKEARAEYSKLILASTEELADKKEDITFKKFIEEIYLPWYKNSGERKYLQESLLDHSKTLCLFLQEESVRNRSDKCTDLAAQVGKTIQSKLCTHCSGNVMFSF